MYNEIIASRLSNLKNLGALKKANITILSKKNNFGDAVKFFAQINTKKIIQKITFKASGCSTFVAMCSYFCDMVQGKTIEQALAISIDDLTTIANLDSSRYHVYPIILDTFKLMIKKYNKGIEKGTITPCEVIEDTESAKKTNSKKKVQLLEDLEDIIAKNKAKAAKITEKSVAKTKNIEKSDNKNTSISTEEKSVEQKTIKDSVVAESKNVETIETKDTKPVIEKKSESKKSEKAKKTVKKEKVSKEKKSAKVEEKPQEEKLEVVVIEDDKQDEQPATISPEIIVEDTHEHEHIIHVKEEVVVTETTINSENESKKIIEERKTSHLMALRQKINNKENNEKAHKNADSLSNMLKKLNKTNAQQQEEIKQEPVEQKETKKKSLFSWFKKK